MAGAVAQATAPHLETSQGEGQELVGVHASASVCVLDGVLHATGASYVALEPSLADTGHAYEESNRQLPEAGKSGTLQVKGLDTDNMFIQHIQVNQAQKQRRRTYRAHGRINRAPLLTDVGHCAS